MKFPRTRSSNRRAVLLVAALAAGVLAHTAAAATLEVGAGKTYKLPSEALKAAHDGDTVKIDAGDYTDCAVVAANNLVIEGAGPDASAALGDKSCAEKAILVLDGHDITVRNLTLQRARVPDGNGAGIRAEGNGLTVDGVKFLHNENGILAAPNPDETITVRNSQFIRNGSCDPTCAHGIYIGAIKLLHVENSKFLETHAGHHIKSRAARTEVIGCTIDDGSSGDASYLIDIPNGGTLIARNNTMTKGPKAQNRGAAIMIGEEGVNQATPEITVADNIFRNAGDYNTTFVVNRTATDAMLTGNKLSGNVEPLEGDGQTR